MRRWRGGAHHLALTGVLLLLTVLLLAAARQARPPEPIPFDLDSDAPSGLRLLRLWLGELGYPVERADSLQFPLPPEVTLLFVYPNQLTYTPEEAAGVRTWVEAGGTLVLVGPDPQDSALEAAFGVRAMTDATFSPVQRPVQPLLSEGAARYDLAWGNELHALDLSAAPTAVPVLMSDAGEITGAVQTVGAGWVWHFIPPNGLTNLGLASQGHGDFLPPVLRGARPGGVVLFDTFHLFGISRIGERIDTLQDWLYRTPTGWATLSALLMVGGFLLLQGRRLGPPLMVATNTRRREAAEFVQAMAGLQQRARLAGDVARYQKQRLKRGLAQGRAVSPDLPDGLFLEQLQSVQPPLPAETLATVRMLLRGLDGTPEEHALVMLAAQVDTLLG